MPAMPAMPAVAAVAEALEAPKPSKPQYLSSSNKKVVIIQLDWMISTMLFHPDLLL